MTAVIKANHIYTVTGVPTFPWQVDEWPSDWMSAILAYQVDVPKKRDKIKSIEAKAHGRNTNTHRGSG